jgi:hypothetical protein
MTVKTYTITEGTKQRLRRFARTRPRDKKGRRRFTLKRRLGLDGVSLEKRVIGGRRKNNA